jgi:hypothetical protein
MSESEGEEQLVAAAIAHGVDCYGATSATLSDDHRVPFAIDIGLDGGEGAACGQSKKLSSTPDQGILLLLPDQLEPGGQELFGQCDLHITLDDPVQLGSGLLAHRDRMVITLLGLELGQLVLARIYLDGGAIELGLEPLRIGFDFPQLSLYFVGASVALLVAEKRHRLPITGMEDVVVH